MTETEPTTSSFFQSVQRWRPRGSPDGPPRTAYPRLPALGMRAPAEDGVVQAAFSVLKDGDPDNPVSAEQIRDAVPATTEKEPTGEEINQVAARLAMVGWPLSDHG